MDSDRWFVSCSDRVRLQFRRMLDYARLHRLLEPARRSAQWILDELSRTPAEFESRYEIPSMNLKVRLAIVGPVMVLFAVNEAEQIVFVFQFGLMKR